MTPFASSTWRRGVRDGDSASPKNPVNVKAAAATADDRAGVIRPWEVSCGPNAHPVRFGTGRGVEEQVSDGVEVIVAGFSKVGNHSGGPRGARHSGRGARVHTQRGSVRDREHLGRLRLPRRSPSAKIAAHRPLGGARGLRKRTHRGDALSRVD